MGSCRKCGGKTNYPHNNAWCTTCFYLNTEKPRFWISVVATLVALNLPFIDEQGIMSLMMGALFQETKSLLFLVGKVIIDLIIIGGTFVGISKGIYTTTKLP